MLHMCCISQYCQFLWYLIPPISTVSVPGNELLFGYTKYTHIQPLPYSQTFVKAGWFKPVFAILLGKPSSSSFIKNLVEPPCPQMPIDLYFNPCIFKHKLILDKYHPIIDNETINDVCSFDIMRCMTCSQYYVILEYNWCMYRYIYATFM